MSDRPPGPPDRARTFPKVGALRACLKPPTNRPAGPFSALEHRARRPLSPIGPLDLPCPGSCKTLGSLPARGFEQPARDLCETLSMHARVPFTRLNARLRPQNIYSKISILTLFSRVKFRAPKRRGSGEGLSQRSLRGPRQGGLRRPCGGRPRLRRVPRQAPLPAPAVRDRPRGRSGGDREPEVRREAWAQAAGGHGMRRAPSIPGPTEGPPDSRRGRPGSRCGAVEAAPRRRRGLRDRPGRDPGAGGAGERRQTGTPPRKPPR